MIMSAIGPRRFKVLVPFWFDSACRVVLRAAGGALHQIHHAANRQYRNNKEECDKSHPALVNEVTDCAAFSAAILRRERFRPPGKEVSADDEEERDHEFCSPFSRFGWIPVVRTLLHVGVWTFHPSFRAMQ